MLSVFAGLAIVSAPANVAVMVHGAGGGGWEYDFWKPVFEKSGWRVIARDLVPAKDGLAQTTFSDYVSQVVAWVPKERGKLVLVGASMGGILVLKAAERLKPDAVVLVNSVTPAGVGPAQAVKTYPPVIEWANGPLKDTRDSMPDSDEKTILWAWKKWRNESGAVLTEISRGVKASPPKCRTLVVLGEKDTDIAYTRGLDIAKWAKADVHLYSGMSHVGPLMSTRGSEVARAVVGWLKS